MKNSILGVPSTAQPNGGAESGAPEKYPEPRSGPEARGRRVATFWGMNWIALTSEGVDVRRDEQGVPVEWTLLRIGDNPICQEGEDGNISISPEQMNAIVEYFEKKGEEIPIDSEHYLYELASKNKIDESEALKLFPSRARTKSTNPRHSSCSPAGSPLSASVSSNSSGTRSGSASNGHRVRISF